ncbi:DUF2169 family type VI secretion system accessory protein [Pseudomonas nicosulfuronedens]
MRFENTTPFNAMCFTGLDLKDKEFRVVVLKVAYRLKLSGDRVGAFVAELMLEKVPPLCMKDNYFGEVNRSSVREESDLAHYKPRCDVIVNGHAHAPNGLPAIHWNIRLKVSAPKNSKNIEPLPVWLSDLLSPATQARYPERWLVPVALGNPYLDEYSNTHQVLLDKILRVTGEREFLYSGFDWRITKPKAVVQVPLQWERAFGGSSVVHNPEYQQGTEQPEYLLNEVCFSNPLGCGWVEERYERALQTGKREPFRRMPAPQIESLEKLNQHPTVIRHPQQINPTDPNGFIRIAQSYGQLPAGLGVVGRAWTPRLQMAGTYDDAWRNKRWPYLPDDFDFGYWNCAPRDQQIEAPPANMRIELWNLVDPALTADGYLYVDMPDHLAFVTLHRRDSSSVPLGMMIDTVSIDTDAMMVTLIYRLQVVESHVIDKLEVNFRTRSNISLMRNKADTIKV